MLRLRLHNEALAGLLSGLSAAARRLSYLNVQPLKQVPAEFRIQGKPCNHESTAVLVELSNDDAVPLGSQVVTSICMVTVLVAAVPGRHCHR